MKFDPTKPVKTRNGSKARILASDLPGEFPIVAALVEDDNYEIASYTVDGRYWSDGTEDEDDLVNVPEEREVWLNVRKCWGSESISTVGYNSKSDADRPAVENRIARVRVKFFEGQFDD